MPFWCCVRTKPRAEVYASERIQAAGYATLLPLLPPKPRGAPTPLFPGYVFALVIQQWRALNTTFGVLAVVRTGDCPCRMPESEIETLKAMIVGGFVRLPGAESPTAKRQLAIGARVRIASGPFGGMSGLYAGMSTKDRERVLLNLLGAARPVLVPSNLVIPA
jgi:transcriptional antiterminator RfaH